MIDVSKIAGADPNFGIGKPGSDLNTAETLGIVSPRYTIGIPERGRGKQ